MSIVIDFNSFWALSRNEIEKKIKEAVASQFAYPLFYIWCKRRRRRYI